MSSPELFPALFIVPKRSPALYRLTVDYRPLKAVTRSMFRPMSDIAANLNDTRRCEAFAGIDYCSGYLRSPLYPVANRSSLLAISMALSCIRARPKKVVTLLPTSKKKLKNVLLSSSRISRHRLTNLRDPSEASLLCMLHRFFEICRKRRQVVSLPKSDFFFSEGKCCGWIIDAQGVFIRSKNISGFSNCEPICTAGEF